MPKIELVYWKDRVGGELERLVTEAFPYSYSAGPKGEWQMVVASEDKEVRANEVVSIKIEKIEVPERAIIMPCSVMRHALGFVPALVGVGKPKLVEDKRVFEEALFHPISNGFVRRGELLGVVNVLYATVERKLTREVVEKWLSERFRY